MARNNKKRFTKATKKTPKTQNFVLEVQSVTQTLTPKLINQSGEKQNG